MARSKISEEQRRLEGAKLEGILEAARNSDANLTQDSLADEMSVTQGLLSQWVTGKTPIPDKRLLWLGRRLDFDPRAIRPSLSDYVGDSTGAVSVLSEINASLTPEGQAKLLDFAEMLRSVESKE